MQVGIGLFDLDDLDSFCDVGPDSCHGVGDLRLNLNHPIEDIGAFGELLVTSNVEQDRCRSPVLRDKDGSLVLPELVQDLGGVSLDLGDGNNVWEHM